MKRRPFISQKEIAALLRTPAEKRCGHLLGQIADWGGIWCLKCDREWLTVDDARIGRMLPIWPHEPYAAAYVEQAGKADFEPTGVSLSRWINELSPLLARQHIEVFPTAMERGIVMSIEEFNRSLSSSLAAYSEDLEAYRIDKCD